MAKPAPSPVLDAEGLLALGKTILASAPRRPLKTTYSRFYPALDLLTSRNMRVRDIVRQFVDAKQIPNTPEAIKNHEEAFYRHLRRKEAQPSQPATA